MIDTNIWVETSSKLERQQHLALTEECLERGGSSYQHRGVLAEYLKTSIPKKHSNVHLCHACNNGDCSNPRHLYWGTLQENIEDAILDGAYIRSGKQRQGKPGHSHSEKTKQQISNTLTGRPSNNPTGIGGGKNKGCHYQRAYPQMWITDGDKSTRIPLGQEIPSGWKRGRTQKLFGPPSTVSIYIP